MNQKRAQIFDAPGRFLQVSKVSRWSPEQRQMDCGWHLNFKVENISNVNERVIVTSVWPQPRFTDSLWDKFEIDPVETRWKPDGNPAETHLSLLTCESNARSWNIEHKLIFYDFVGVKTPIFFFFFKAAWKKGKTAIACFRTNSRLKPPLSTEASKSRFEQCLTCLFFVHDSIIRQVK